MVDTESPCLRLSVIDNLAAWSPRSQVGARIFPHHSVHSQQLDSSPKITTSVDDVNIANNGSDMNLPTLTSGVKDEPSMTRPTLKDSTEAVIRRALLDGTMLPGEIYSANALSAQLGISNSPAREAMVTLMDKGLLELVRNRGFRVVEMSDHDRGEVYELRMLIEVDAVRRVAVRGVNAEEAAWLRELCEAIIEAGNSRNSVEYLEADQRFHVGLVSLLGNSRLTLIVENLRDQSRINGGYDEIDLIEKSVLEHRAITEAVIDGDPVLAAELMARHLDYAKPKQTGSDGS